MSTNNSLIDSISTLSSTLLLLLPLAITIERSRSRKQQQHSSHQPNGNKSDKSSAVDKESNAIGKKQSKLRHAYIPNLFTQKEMDDVFVGINKHWTQTSLPEYSRYENWTQSCYVEVDPRWTPQPEINKELSRVLKDSGTLERCTKAFENWYKDLKGLSQVDVTILNAFVTKYVPEKGKNEFGKHVDGIRVDGSLILGLPTNDEHDWPGIIVWDGEKTTNVGGGTDGGRPEFKYNLNPGDILCLDKLIWHHGLPITKGVRFVLVFFFKCQWKKIASNTTAQIAPAAT